jgi:ATP-dependent DNA helicase DinG
MLDEQLLVMLARIALPTASDHSLEALARHYGLGAAARQKQLEAVFLRLVEELEALPPAVIEESNWLLAQVDTPLKEIFAEIERATTRSAFGAGRLRLEELLPDFTRALKRKPKRPAEEYTPLDIDRLSAFFGDSGPLKNLLPAYEERTPQREMLKEVALALNEGHHLMAEAGTGTGKSLAYLLPAIEWALANHSSVVISTNTKNLQAQLWEKDIPCLRKALGKPFDAALIKGRGNYLCVRKLLYVLRQAPRELSEEERVALLSILTWLSQTRTGDIAENTGFSGFGLPGLWQHLYSVGPDCPGRRCRRYRNCFLMKARALSLSSDIVVANHAVVFSEIALQTSAVLPQYQHIIFDEAQNVEDVATDHLAVAIDRWRLSRPLRRLFRRDRSGAGTGLIPGILAQLARAKDLPDEAVESLRAQANEVMESVMPVEEASASFLAGIEGIVAGGRRVSEKIRYEREDLAAARWQSVIAGKGVLVAGIGALTRAMKKLQDGLESLAPEALEFGLESAAELGAQREILSEIAGDAEFLLRADDPDYVYWAERVTQEPPAHRLAAAPIDISRLMHDRVYEPNRTVILSSATLTVGGSFDYLKERLGLCHEADERVRATDVGTTFDYPSQCRALVPTFLPEPFDEVGDFAGELAGLLSELCPSLPGGTLVLFTSYDMLNRTHAHLMGNIPDDLLVLAQGADGTREQITRMFRRNKRAVLLGTHSFWEGVDLPGETLCCLVLAKLPFQVHKDPVVEARCELLRERGRDAFLSYSLPHAVLRFRQGFGRLIRRKEDKGVVVICDKRVVSKRYGSAFLRSLPTSYRVFGRREQLVLAAADFLTAKQPAQPKSLDRDALMEILSKRRGKK